MSKEKIKAEENTAAEAASTQEGKVGTMLHDVRIKKKISIEEVAKDLYIKPAYLTAIEKSDYDNIPESPYGVGFVRSYAAYLGLNSERIVQIFKEETGAATPLNIDSPKIVIPEEDSDEPSQPNRKYLILSLVLLIVAYGSWKIFSETPEVEENELNQITEQSTEDYPLQVENFSTESEEPTVAETIAEEPQQITVTDAKFTESSPEESFVEKPAEKNGEENAIKTEDKTPVVDNNTNVSAEKYKNRVVLKVKKETWVEVKDDNKLWISKVLQAGSEYIVPDNGAGKTVSFGNTNGVDVVIDGKVVTIVSPNKKTNIKLDAFLNNNH